jgi:hypothetical protein
MFKRRKRVKKERAYKKGPPKKVVADDAKRKRGEVNPLIGVTDGHLRAQIRSALRKTWRNSSRRVYIQSVRVPYEGKAKFRWAVLCAECDHMMGQSEKAYDLKKDGTKTKHRKLVYEVDHITGNPEFTDIVRDLGEYAHSLLYGKLRILCRKCHGERTGLQSQERNARKKSAAIKAEIEAEQKK